MKVKQILALICVTALLFTQNVLPAFATEDSDSEVTTVTVESEFFENLTVNKIYDGSAISQMEFSDVALPEVREGDKVHLTATAEFSSENVGDNIPVKLSSFYLAGDDASKYILNLPTADYSVDLSGSIAKKTIHLIPKEEGANYTVENYPKLINYEINGDDTVGGDFTTVNAKMYIVYDDATKLYSYALSDDSTVSNSNYTIAVAENLVPTVVSPDAPVINSAVITKKDATELNIFDFGIVANGSVTLAVSAVSKQKFPVEFKLSNGQTKTVEACEELVTDDGKNKKIEYIYTANFDILNANKDDTFECSVSNDSNSVAENVRLNFEIATSDKTTKYLIIEKEYPTEPNPVKNMRLKYNNDRKTISVNGELINYVSGIKFIEYKWDNKSDYHKYEKFTSTNANNTVSVNFEIAYDNNSELGDPVEGKHSISFKITDHAGNVYESESNTYLENPNDGMDTTPPVITNAEMLPQTEGKTLDSIITISNDANDDANFVNSAVELKIKVSDKSESATVAKVGSVELCGKNTLTGIDDIRISMEQSSVEDDEYSVTLDKDLSVKDLSIRVTDNFGNVSEEYLSAILKKYNNPEVFDWESIKLNKWVFDLTSTSIEFEHGSTIKDEENVYYNNDGGKITVNVSDENLASIKIVKLYQSPTALEPTRTEIDISESEFNTKISHKIIINTEDESYATGKYTYVITAKDFANTEATTKTIDFYVEHDNPTGELTVVSPKVSTVNGNNWVKESDDKTITFRLYPQTFGSALKQFDIKINDNDFKTITADSIKKDENGKAFVDFTVEKDAVAYKNNAYNVSAKVITFAQNSGDTAYNLHIDTENPKVDKFTVKNKNTAIENIINVLTFGVFCKNSITLTVNASDGEFDVGLDTITITYKNKYGDSISEDKKFDSTNVYTWDIDLPENTLIYENDIEVTVTDKLKNSSTELPNIENTESDGTVSDTHFVMIEQKKPTSTIKLPDSDGGTRTGDQVWYKSDKTINLSINDSDSGIRQIEFFINGQKFDRDTNGTELACVKNTENAKQTSLSYEFSTEKIASLVDAKSDGSYNMEYQVIDNAGNVSDKYEKVFYRDLSNPTITQFSFEPATVDGINNTTDFIQNLEYGFYFKNSATMYVIADDTNSGLVPSSGLDKAEFRLVSYDNSQVVSEKTVTSNFVGNRAACVIPKDFKGQIFVKAYDNVTNVSDEKTSYATVVDDTPAEISISPLPDNNSKTDDNGNKLYTQTIEFTATISDTKSGLKSVSYAKSSDLDSYNTVVTTIDNKAEYTVGQDIGNGWIIQKIDANLVTEVSKKFTFDKNKNDKNIFMSFNATNNSLVDSQIINSEKFTIDTVSPTIEKFAFEPVSVDSIAETDDFVTELNYGFYFKKTFNATAYVNDATPSSGLDQVVFRLVSYDNGEVVADKKVLSTVSNNKAVCNIPAGFKGQVFAQVYDRAQNHSSERTPQAFVVDNDAPQISIEALPDNDSKVDMNGNKLYTGEIQYRVTITDKKAGLKDISFSKSSEKDSFDSVATHIDNTVGKSGKTEVGNGWQITATDSNLVTEVSQVFTFNSDDNDIEMSFNATDNSKNTSKTQKSEKFTIDTISPRVVVSNPNRPIHDRYFKDSTTYTITVTERNFDEKAMVSTIENTFSSSVPSVSFETSASDSNVHIATVTFAEGDYDFTFTGKDCAGHVTDVFVDNGTERSDYFHTSFNVDSTAPVVTTNFNSFGSLDDTQIYFNKEQVASIEVIEHNFDESDVNIKVESKMSGTGHSKSSADWYEIGYVPEWKSTGDTHTLQIKFDKDAIYRISINPVDRVNNQGAQQQTAVYEIDTQQPVLYSRNDKIVSKKETAESSYYEIYDEKKKDLPAPSVQFEDLNFDRIEVSAVVYRPEYKNGMELQDIKVDPISNKISAPVKSKEFSLSDFNKDGVYSISYVAVDKAGNKSTSINDTYFRMIDTDMLAYIYNSDKNSGTGYYSLMDEDGKAISKKASDFQDIDVSVIKLNNDNETGSLALREDEMQYSLDDYVTVENQDISKTAVLSKTHLPASYFSETFRDDSLDTRMYLSVKMQNDTYLDLAAIHIDNEPPTATLPQDFASWNNYMFTDKTTVTLTNISETLSEQYCKIYECLRDGQRSEIPFEYNKADKTMSFTLNEGLHNIDITLVDEAGNEWNVDRVRYLRVGNFRLYLAIGVLLLAVGVTVGIVLLRKRKKSKTTK